MCPVKNFSPPTAETSQWKTFVRVCELDKSDCRAILSLEYTTMQRLSMFGIHKNANSLTKAGISDAKAHMIVLFATYMLHMKHHQKTIPKNVTFDQIIDLNYRLSSQQNVPAAKAGKESGKDVSWDSRGSFCSQLSMDSIIQSSDVSVCSRKSCMKKVSWAKQNSEVEQKPIRRRLSTLDESSTSTTVDSVSCASRWSSCDATAASLSSGKRAPQNSSLERVVPPPRRPSLGEESYDRLMSRRNKKKEQPTTTTTNSLPPSKPKRTVPPTPAERSTLRWAVAMNVDEELTDSESEWDDGDYSDSEEDEETFATERSSDDGEDSDNTTKTGWESRIATAHEWTLPANQIIPVNLQALFRRAAENPSLDIQQEIEKAMAAQNNSTCAAASSATITC